MRLKNCHLLIAALILLAGCSQSKNEDHSQLVDRLADKSDSYKHPDNVPTFMSMDYVKGNYSSCVMKAGTPFYLLKDQKGATSEMVKIISGDEKIPCIGLIYKKYLTVTSTSESSAPVDDETNARLKNLKILGDLAWQDFKTFDEWTSAFPGCASQLDPNATPEDGYIWDSGEKLKALSGHDKATRNLLAKALELAKQNNETKFGMWWDRGNNNARQITIPLEYGGEWWVNFPVKSLQGSDRDCSFNLGGVTFQHFEIKITKNSLIPETNSYTSSYSAAVPDPIERKAFWAAITSGKAMHRRVNVFNNEGEIVETKYCTTFSCISKGSFYSETEPGTYKGVFYIEPTDYSIESMESEVSVDSNAF